MILKDLFFNLTILLAISVLSGFIDLRVSRSSLRGKIVQGLLFGFACIVGMLYPFILSEGVIFDGRSVIISLAALFFGPVSGIISASMAIFYRIIIIGGPGASMGTAVIITSMGIGLAFHYWLRAKKSRKLSLGSLYLFGLLVHIVMLLDMLFLPNTLVGEVFRIISFSVIGVYPVASLIIGKILLDQEQNKMLLETILDDEELYRTTLFSVSEAIITTDPFAKILQMNPVAETLTNWKEADAINIEIDTVFPLFDERTHEPFQNFVYQVIKTDAKFDSKEAVVLRTKNGAEIPIFFRCAPRLSKEGIVIGSVIVFRDLSIERQNKLELMRSAESYQGLFNSATGAIYIQDREGRFLDVNKGATIFYGYTKEEMIGKTPEFLSAPGKNNMKLIQSYIEAAFNGKPQHFEFWGLRKNGEQFPKEMSLFKTLYDGKEAILAFGQDITERKLAQLELAMSEERYHTLFDSASVGICLIDQNEQIININETACKQYGYRSDELIGQKIEKIVPEENRHYIKPNIAKIFKDKVLMSRINAFTKSGEPKVFELVESLIMLSNGSKGVLSISKDITEQVKSEKRIQESEARNNAILSAIPDLFFLINQDGYFIDVETDDDSLLLIPFEESRGKNCTDLLPPEVAKLTMDAIHTTLKTNELVQFEYELTIQDKPKWFDARIVKSGSNEVLAIIRDISERHQAEVELKHKTLFIETLLDSVPYPLFYIDTSEKYIGINQAYRDFFDIQNKDIIGKSLYDINKQVDAVEYSASDKQIFEGKEIRQTLDRKMVLPNNDQKEVIITKSVYLDQDNKIGGLIGIIVDITERKKMENDLLSAKEKAEESDHLKTSFLHNLSHEIRTPLNAIIGFSDLLYSDYPDEQKVGFIEIINNNADQLLHIIDDVLAISRLEAEKIPIDNENFAIHDLLGDLYHTFQQVTAKKNLVLLQSELTDDLPKIIFNDKRKIRQVIAGFIENAIKYTPKGIITLSCRLVDNQLQFSVEDTGMGIQAKEQPHVFERFYRTDEVQLKAIRGNGLGLSIAKGLIDLLGGTIGLESEKGKGSRFYFNIPLQQSDSKSQIVPTEPVTKARNISGYDVLVVEDELDQYNYLVSILQSHVKSMRCAVSGDEAIKLVATNSFDLILMDIKLPITNGVEASTVIKKMRPTLPIIVISAIAQEEEIEKTMAAGCNSYLLKPVTKGQVFSAINAL